MSDDLARAGELLRLHRPRDAVQAALRHLAGAPADPAGLYLLALAQHDLGQTAAARNTAQSAIAADPAFAPAHLALAVASLARAEGAIARASAERAIELDPDLDQAWQVKAHACAMAGDARGALAAVDAAVALAPDDAEHHALRAEFLRRLGRKDEAAAALRAAAALDPGDRHVLLQQAQVQLRTGDPAAAAGLFVQVLRAAPAADSARRGLLEALRAGSRFYRVALALRLWLRDFVVCRGRIALAILIAAIAASRLVHEAIRPAMFAVLLLPTSLADFCLLWHPLGRHALKRSEKITAWLVLPLVAAAAGLGALALALPTRGYGLVAGRCLLGAVFVAMCGFAASHTLLDAAARRRLTVLLALAVLLFVGVVIQRLLS